MMAATGPTARSAAYLATCLAAYLACGAAVAQTTPTEKLDAMLSSWRGHTLEELQDVWGREESIERRGGNKVYVYERRVKVRANVFGVTVHGNGGLRCVARFEVDEQSKIVRTSRQGGGQDCWSALRKLDP
jgi:hypothetical protein